MFSSNTFGHAMRDRSGPCLPSNSFANSAGRFLVSLSIPNGRRKSLLDNYGLSELVKRLATDAHSQRRMLVIDLP